MRQWQVSGAGINNRLGIVRGAFRSDDLCRCLFDLRREAEQAGILDFSVSLAVTPVETSDPLAKQVDLFATISRGQPYRIRRIEFEGNKRFSDSTIRATFCWMKPTCWIRRCFARASIGSIGPRSLSHSTGGA